MRPPRALLLLLASAALAAAQSTPECENGLDKLNNQSGQSPCTVWNELMKACSANSSSIGQCKCNTVTYNIRAACAACSGDGPPNWTQFAGDQSCGSNPQQFPSNVDVAHGTIPKWAYMPLTEDNEFDMGAVLAEATSSGSSSRMNVATQVAVPIAAAVGVAMIVTFVFWLYWRRRMQRHSVYNNPRMKTLPLIPGAQSNLWRPWRWFYTLWPAARSRRLRPSKKNSDWAIDDEDSEWLGHARAHSSASYVDPYMLASVHASSPPAEEPLEMDDVPHTSAHLHETSSSSLLPHLDFPDVRVPTFFERFIKSKGGVRKSPSYKSKHVSPVSPDPQFRIDDSAGPTPVRNEFAALAPRLPSLGRSAGSGGSAGASGSARGSARIQPIITERSDFEPVSEGQMGSSVLIISHDGRDFSLDDTATTAPSHSHSHDLDSPRTPSTFRQTSTVYSGTRTNTNTGTGSWLPSPNRANTSSTLSGAYPTELRRDPELTSPRSWAARFPAPPQAFSQSPTAFRSFTEQMELPAYAPARGS